MARARSLVFLGVLGLAATLTVASAVHTASAQTLLLPARGEPSAPVVIMLFSDFQCPYCAQVEPVLASIRKDFPKDVQVIFKHNPLPIHQQAPLAHEAAIEAARQGKFWEMHDLLFANQAKLGRDDLIGYAGQLQLDTAAFTRALDTHVHRPFVERDMAEARSLGITSTPVLFINGRRGQGVPPAPQLHALIKSLVTGVEMPDGPPPVPPGTFDLTGSPTKGPANAPVTIVEFSDFQCGFCLRANSTVAQLLAKYPTQVRLVFKNFPIESHVQAPLAHRAAYAAQQQGKFWEMHDAIFGNQRAMTRADLLKYATTLGLDVTRFTADLDGTASKAILDRDLAEGAKIGIDGTPTFFINGQPLVGAQPLDRFVAIIDNALAAPPTAQKPAP